MTADATSLAAAIKVMYPQRAIKEAYLRECPTFGMIKHSTRWKGNPMHIALALTGTPGSHTFSNALTNSGQVVNRGFDVTIVRDYNVVQIQTETIRMTAGEEGALVAGIKQQADGALYTQKKTLGVDFFRSGTGSRGRIASGADTDTLTLTDPYDAYNFEVGDVLVSNDGDDATTPSTNTGTITAIDYDAGTLTAAAAWHADFDTNDYLFRDGDVGLSMAGLAAWVPSSAPSATTFFGLDRTTSTRLSGVRYDYTVAGDGTMERYLINLCTRVCRLGGHPDIVVMSPIRWGNFENELGDKARYDRVTSTSDASVGFDVITIMGPRGKVKVLADPYCPHNRVYALTTSTWCFYTLGEMGWLDDDGKGQWLRQYNADALQARLGWYGNLTCEFPGANGTGSVSALNA